MKWTLNRTRYTRLWLVSLLCLISFGTIAESQIEVKETFYRLTKAEGDANFNRAEIIEARPGDLLELEVEAVNTGTQTLTDLLLVNTVPTGGAQLIEGSFKLDGRDGEFRLSRNGNTFFPAGVDMPANEIGYIQWLIYSLPAGERAVLSYRLRVPRAGE
ncbi:DUF11 domain-containing protein [Saccharospirillum impatiens]|uniref:DUF11 domain-containing protein n=1 Tax=Saccharospirillum impatiens TaxID=169438 RepID=UPI0004033790|nr:DUF11 domain-containing protein [Saccharospirillum impatiens]